MQILIDIKITYILSDIFIRISGVCSPWLYWSTTAKYIWIVTVYTHVSKHQSSFPKFVSRNARLQCLPLVKSLVCVGIGYLRLLSCV
jgi:hypothetical protein